MSLASGVGAGPDFIGGLSVPRIWAPKKRCYAAAFRAHVSSGYDLLNRLTASFMNRQSTVANYSTGQLEKEIHNDFGRIADVFGLTENERTVLFGMNRELSRVILALEIIDAALDLFCKPVAAAAWLRSENSDEPFDGESPLQLMAAGGGLGVEITLLYLRARVRQAPRGEASVRVLAERLLI